MKFTKSFAIAAAALVGAIALGTSVYAAQVPGTFQNRTSALVQAIASKFNLNTADVQKVFDDQRAQQQADMQAKNEQRFTDRLAQAVKDGKLTQAQSDLVTAKHQEVQTFMESLKDKTVADRQAALKTEMDSLKQWATDNNIPEGYLPMGFGPGRGMMGGHEGFGGRGMGEMRGGWNKGAAPTTATEQQ